MTVHEVPRISHARQGRPITLVLTTSHCNSNQRALPHHRRWAAFTTVFVCRQASHLVSVGRCASRLPLCAGTGKRFIASSGRMTRVSTALIA